MLRQQPAGTPMALETKVNQRNIGTGLATRLAAIPMPSTHFRMIKHETLEDVGPEPEEDKTLRMWAERLDKEYGELPIKKLVDECYDWTARRMEDAKDDNSKVDEILCKRVAYYGINVSVPFIVMRHWEWHIMASTSAFPSSSCATGMSGSSIAHSPSTTLISISASWCATSNSAVRATSSATTGSRISECRNKGSLVLDRKGITQRR